MSSGFMFKNKDEQKQADSGYIIAHDYLEEQREKEANKGFTPEPVMAWINEDEYYEESHEDENISLFEKISKNISESKNDRLLAKIDKKFEKLERQKEKKL